MVGYNKKRTKFKLKIQNRISHYQQGRQNGEMEALLPEPQDFG